MYRTECTLPNGMHTEGWDLGDSIPYLWSPGEGCEAHSLTRYQYGPAKVIAAGGGAGALLSFAVTALAFGYARGGRSGV